MKILIPALGGLLAAAAPASAANLLTNGGFEQPGGIVRDYLSNVTLPGWTYDSNGTGNDIYEDDSEDGLVAADGSHYLSFGHNGTSGGSISQTFATHAGGQFHLALSTAEQQGDDPAQKFTVLLVTGNGGTYSFDIGNLTSSFTTTAIDFFPDAATTTITITDATPSGFGGGSNLALDAVNITEVGGVGAVPEPASWALMLGGFGVTGGALRRRRMPLTAINAE